VSGVSTAHREKNSRSSQPEAIGPFFGRSLSENQAPNHECHCSVGPSLWVAGSPMRQGICPCGFLLDAAYPAPRREGADERIGRKEVVEMKEKIVTLKVQTYLKLVDLADRYWGEVAAVQMCAEMEKHRGYKEVMRLMDVELRRADEVRTQARRETGLPKINGG